MPLRSLIFWPHLVAGLVAGAIVLVMSATGVLLTYERQLIAWSDSHLRSAPSEAGQSRMPVETLIDTVTRANPGTDVSSITVRADATAPVTFGTGQRAIYVDAYSGAVLGGPSQGIRRFMSETRAWHRWLSVEGEGRPVARAITGWSNVLFLFLTVSGLYLWFPRRWTWQHLRPLTLFTPGARGKARDFNWHHVIGLWSLVPLVIVVASAVPISFPWGNTLVYLAMGEEPPARRGEGEGAGARGAGPARGRQDGAAAANAGGAGAQQPQGESRDAAREAERPPQGERAEGTRAEGPRPQGERGRGRREERAAPITAGLNGLLARAERQVDGWTTITVRPPTAGDAPVGFAIDRGDGGQPHLRSTLMLSQAGDVVTYEDFSAQSPARQVRSIMRFAHTGEVLGLPGQTIAGLATAGSVVLVWTGFALAWRRCRAFISRPRAATQAERRGIAA